MDRILNTGHQSGSYRALQSSDPVNQNRFDSSPKALTTNSGWNLSRLATIIATVTVGFVLVAGPSVCFSQEDQKTEEQKKDDQKKEFKGIKDFEKATELKVSAETLRDLDEIAELCRSAIKKGLDKDTKTFCESMLVDALMLYSKTASERVLVRRDRRWQFLRREGLKRLKEVIELKPKNKKAWLLIAQLNVIPGGDREEVSDAVEKLIELSGEDNKTMSEALVIRSMVASNTKDRLSDLQEAIDIYPENIGARRNRGTVLLAANKLKDAIKDFEFLVKNNPKDIRSALILSEIHYKEKNYQKALDILKEIKFQASDPRGEMLKANIYIEMKKFEESIKSADAVLKIDSRNIDIWVVKIRALISLDKSQEAYDQCNKLIRINPRAWQGRWYRSSALASLEKYDEAIEDVQSLVDLFPSPNNGPFMMQLGSLYNASDRPRLAIKHFTEMISDYPDLKSILRSRGDAYLSIGKHKEAIADYEKQLKTTPDDFGTLNNLAWVLSTSPEDDLRDGKRALKLAEKACKLTDYEKPYILSTLASCYAEMGDFENAMKWIEKAKTQAEKEKSDNLEDIIKELEAYKKKKPWREKEDVKEKPLASKKKSDKTDKKGSAEEEEDDF